MRDYASIYELTVLSNLESHNAQLIKEGKTKEDLVSFIDQCSRESVMHTEQTPPDWFLRGIDAALLAPTAMNQQKFVFSLKGNTVTAKAGIGFYSKIDLGIAKYHFELGAGTENFRWG